MWGSVVSVRDIMNKPGAKGLKMMIHNITHDVIVDRVARRNGIFEGCEWQKFISTT